MSSLSALLMRKKSEGKKGRRGKRENVRKVGSQRAQGTVQ